jgi:hypothetical protein
VSGIIESSGNCPQCPGTPELVGNVAVCRQCKTRWRVDGVPVDLERAGEQLRLILEGYREVQPAAVLEAGRGDPASEEGEVTREVEGELSEEFSLKFADKSKLTVSFTVKAGARPHETQAAQFAERVRRALEETR